MKYLIIFFSFFFILSNNVFAEQKRITPDMLTIKESDSYLIVNDLSTKIFHNIEMNIDVNAYPNKYNNFALMVPTETQNKKFYYVQNSNAELIFNRKTKNLTTISFKYSSNPKSWIVYNYPSGTLRTIEIWIPQNQIYIFAPNGKFIKRLILH